MKVQLWYLQFEGTEFGPFRFPELKATLEARKIRGTLYVWCTGMENWVEPQAIPELFDLVKPRANFVRRAVVAEKGRVPTIKAPGEEKRREDRQPLIATVSIVTPPRTRLMLGVCENVTTQGVQVILDADHEISPESSFTLEVSPLGISGAPTFRVVARSVWSSPAVRRVGFRFDRLNSVDRMGLGLYLQAAAEKRRQEDRAVRTPKRVD